ncbi:hypothetical protein J437_LFUL017630 [Ladona fulva]|uniref:Uncharacterized protein n=1 Tax=Ladona fulva TaxID=123851 RepID=A0A8K0KML8_LADFU|nr:hypothetical protein J437_LFUL017630 [Ladona fulva]
MWTPKLLILLCSSRGKEESEKEGHREGEASSRSPSPPHKRAARTPPPDNPPSPAHSSPDRKSSADEDADQSRKERYLIFCRVTPLIFCVGFISFSVIILSDTLKTLAAPADKHVASGTGVGSLMYWTAAFESPTPQPLGIAYRPRSSLGPPS